MNIKCLSLSGAALIALASPAFAEEMLKVHQTANVAGHQVMCGGASLDDQAQMDAKSYPVTLKMVGGYGQWLGQERVSVNGKSGEQISLQCEGPWVMMQLPPGQYQATAEISGASAKTQKFTVANGGNREVIFRFPEKMAGKSRASNAGYADADTEDTPPAQPNGSTTP